MRELGALYLRLVGAQVRSQLQYRTSFALLVAGQFLATFTGFLMIVILFQRFPTLAGWSLWESVLLYGLGTLAFALSDIICGGFDRLSMMIRMGAFDRVLSRPLGAFFQVLASDFEVRRVGRVLQSAVVLCLALVQLEVQWSPSKLLVLGLAVASGALIFCAIWIIGAAITFWTVQTSEVTNVFTYGGEEFVSYPLPIYAEGLRRFFTFVVPLAFVAYLPSLYILERSDPLGLPDAARISSPLVAALFCLVARAAWAAGVRHYQGTGS